MKIIDVIALLEQLGHDVTYSKRSDGGYLIKSIDGKKFSGASGNNFAREITGKPISEKRKAQLTRINPPKAELSKEFKNAIRSAQRWWKKLNKSGKIRTSTWRKTAQERGEAEAISALKQQVAYAKGYAYPANVMAFIERTKQRIVPMSRQSEEWIQICNFMESHLTTIREVEQLQVLIQLQYDCYSSHTMSEEDCIKRSRDVLKM